MLSTSIDTILVEAAGYRVLDPVVSRTNCVLKFADDAGRLVRLKPLEADCLHAGRLHPAIRDRLDRIRNMPHRSVASLRAVERFGGQAYLVWAYVDGKSLEETLLSEPPSVSTIVELVSVVEDLHLLGVVHGSLHARNIIVSASGEVWLTDLSPYLYSDPTEDVAALVDVVRSWAGRTNVSESLQQTLQTFDPARDSLRDLITALSSAGTTVEKNVPQRNDIRWRSVALATVVLLCGVALILLLRRRFH